MAYEKVMEFNSQFLKFFKGTKFNTLFIGIGFVYGNHCAVSYELSAFLICFDDFSDFIGILDHERWLANLVGLWAVVLTVC